MMQILKVKLVTKGTFEARVISDLVARDIPHVYEPEKLAYFVERHYVPDLKIGKMIVELKGYFRWKILN